MAVTMSWVGSVVDKAQLM